MKKIASIVALASVSLVTPFLAHAEGTYVKASIGRSHYKDLGNGAANENPTGVSLGLGYAIDKNWDAEIGYTNFGSVKSRDLSPQINLKTQTIYAAGIGKLPITDTFSVFGKAGVAFNYSKVSTVGLPLEFSKTNTALLLGAGLNYQFTKELAATLDYTHYGKGKVTIEDETFNFKIDQVSVGLKYYF